MMNESITKATPLGLTAPASQGKSGKANAPSQDREIFQEELSFASQASSSVVSNERTLQSDNSIANRRAENRSEPERIDRPERSNKDRNTVDLRERRSDNERNKIDSNESSESSRSSESSNKTTETTSKSTSANDETTGAEDASVEAVEENTTNIEDSLREAIEELELTEDQRLALDELLEQGIATGLLGSEEFRNLIATDPQGAIELAFELIDPSIRASQTQIVSAEQLIADEELSPQGLASKQELSGEELAGISATEEPLEENLQANETDGELNANALNEEASGEGDPNAYAAKQVATESEDENNLPSSKTEGSIDLSSLDGESIDSEADEVILPRIDTTSGEKAPAATTPAALTSEGEANLPLPGANATSEPSSVGQSANVTIDRAEATAGNAKSEARPQVDPARFVTRVTKAFETAQSRGGGPIEIRLSPPELGSLQVRLEVKEGVLTASLETENQAARNALLDNLPALRERLAEQQIRIEKFDVDVRDESSRSDQQEQQADAQNNRERQEQNQTDSPRLAASTTGDRSETIETTKTTIHFPEDGINVVA